MTADLAPDFDLDAGHPVWVRCVADGHRYDATLYDECPDCPELSVDHLDQADDDDPVAESSWSPIDLRDVDVEETPPKWLRRSDGLALLYPGRVHWLQGESESAKSWVALLAVAEAVEAGRRALVVDFEDDARGFRERLAALGLDTDAHAGQLRYVRPLEPLTAPRNDTVTNAAIAFGELVAWRPDVAVVDGVTEGMAIEDLDPMSNRDVATWIGLVPRPLARAGASTVVIDHVTKSTESRGRYAIGAQHKLAALDGAAYIVEAVRPLGRAKRDPVEGLSKLTLAKDRRGHVRGAIGGNLPVADVSLTAYPDGGIVARVAPPGTTGTDEHQARILEHLAHYDGATKTDLRALGYSDAVDRAAKDLAASDLIEIRKEGRSHRHYLTDAGRDRLDALELTTGSDDA